MDSQKTSIPSRASMAHDESAEDFLPQFAAPKSTSPTSSFRQALSQLQTSGLITSTIPSWRSQRQAPRPSASLFQVYQAQTLINHRRLNKALPVGVVLPPGTPWSLVRQLLDWSWSNIIFPFFQGFGWGLLQHWYAFLHNVRPWTWLRQRISLIRNSAT